MVHNLVRIFSDNDIYCPLLSGCSQQCNGVVAREAYASHDVHYDVMISRHFPNVTILYRCHHLRV